MWGVTSPSLDSMNPEPRLVSARTRSRSAWARAADTRLTRLFLLSRHTGAYGDVMGLCVRLTPGLCCGMLFVRVSGGSAVRSHNRAHEFLRACPVRKCSLCGVVGDDWQHFFNAFFGNL